MACRVLDSERIVSLRVTPHDRGTHFQFFFPPKHLIFLFLNLPLLCVLCCPRFGSEWASGALRCFHSLVSLFGGRGSRHRCQLRRRGRSSFLCIFPLSGPDEYKVSGYLRCLSCLTSSSIQEDAGRLWAVCRTPGQRGEELSVHYNIFIMQFDLWNIGGKAWKFDDVQLDIQQDA